ncbi:MAG: hypothetical protein AAFY41_04830 [Bacteroidota bacterium]
MGLINEMGFNQSIVVHFIGWINSLEPVHRLSEQLNELVDSLDNAKFDGHEIAMDGSHGTLYLYCDDARKLIDVIIPTLKSADLLKCTKAVLRLSKLEEQAEEIVISL